MFYQVVQNVNKVHKNNIILIITNSGRPIVCIRMYSTFFNVSFLNMRGLHRFSQQYTKLLHSSVDTIMLSTNEISQKADINLH